MKSILLICGFAFALVNAEPVRYRSSYTNADSDPDVEIQQVEVIEVPWQEGPQTPPQDSYSPPQQEYGPPKQEYGPPKQEYGPPKPVYGPPPETTTTELEVTTTEYPTTTLRASNATSANKTRSGKLKKDDLTERGAYYIYHPNGVLQRVVYATKDDVKNMVYSAQLRYQNVEPVSGPIYTYDPDTYVFQRVSK